MYRKKKNKINGESNCPSSKTYGILKSRSRHYRTR
jgi:hypothetical protein